MQHPAADRLLDELLAGLSARDVRQYPYQWEGMCQLAVEVWNPSGNMIHQTSQAIGNRKGGS